MQQMFHMLQVHPNKYSVDVNDRAKKMVVKKSLESLHKHQQVSKCTGVGSDLATNV